MDFSESGDVPNKCYNIVKQLESSDKALKSILYTP